MASSSSQPPAGPNPSPPSLTSTTAPSSSPPASTSTNTAPTTTRAYPISPPPATSTAASSLSSPPFLHPQNARPPPAAPSSTSHSLSPTLPPSPPQPRQIQEARAAVLAGIGNMLDSSLRDRAAVLHANNAAIAKQERDVAKATEALRKENDRLAKVAGDAAKRVKELGNVQNWAEVLERDFLVLEETVRLVRRGSEGSWSGSGSGSWSGSGSGSESGDERVEDGDVRMEGVDGGDVGAGKVDKGKGKEVDDRMDIDGPATGVQPNGLGARGDGAMDMSGVDLLPVRNTTREVPSIKVPGIESSQTSTISLEDELRIAMDQPIGASV